MPAVSRAQQRWAYWAEAHPEEAKVDPATARDFQKPAKGKKLPERKKPDRHHLAEAIRRA